MKIPAHMSAPDIERAIDTWIVGRNAKRNRQILKARLIDGMCYEPLAERFDMSVRQIKNIVYAGENRIFSSLK